MQNRAVPYPPHGWSSANSEPMMIPIHPISDRFDFRIPCRDEGMAGFTCLICGSRSRYPAEYSEDMDGSQDECFCVIDRGTVVGVAVNAPWANRRGVHQR